MNSYEIFLNTTKHCTHASYGISCTFEVLVKWTSRTIWDWEEVISRQPSWAAKGRRNGKDLRLVLKRLNVGCWGPSPSSASAPYLCLCYGHKPSVALWWEAWQMTWNNKGYRFIITAFIHKLSIGGGSATKICSEDRLSPHCLQVPTPTWSAWQRRGPLVPCGGFLSLNPEGEVGQSQCGWADLLRDWQWAISWHGQPWASHLTPLALLSPYLIWRVGQNDL